VGSKWLAEITERCPGVKVVLVALKCDLREEHEKDDDGQKGNAGQREDDGHDDSIDTPSKQIIQYQEGLEVARKIGALRYLGTSECHRLADVRRTVLMWRSRMLRNAQSWRERSLY
jgi:Rho family, other